MPAIILIKYWPTFFPQFFNANCPKLKQGQPGTHNKPSHAAIVIYCKYWYNSENILSFSLPWFSQKRDKPSQPHSCAKKLEYLTQTSQQLAGRQMQTTQNKSNPGLFFFLFFSCLTCTATYSTGLVKPHSNYYYPANSRPLGESLARRILAQSKQALRNVLEWADQASFSHAGTLENHPWCLAWEDACT